VARGASVRRRDYRDQLSIVHVRSAIIDLLFLISLSALKSRVVRSRTTIFYYRSPVCWFFFLTGLFFTGASREARYLFIALPEILRCAVPYHTLLLSVAGLLFFFDRTFFSLASREARYLFIALRR
jgi:hypothetical protein